MQRISTFCSLGAGICFAYSIFDIFIRRQYTAQDAFILGLTLLIVGLGTHKTKV